MLCLYLTIALCITGMLPVSLGASFNPGLKRDKGLRRLHKREVQEDSPVPRAIADNFTEGVGGKAHADEASKSHRSLNENWNFISGIAIIGDDYEGALCVGVHLKPRIILTTAACVSDQLVENTAVTIVHGKHRMRRNTVRAKHIILNPDYNGEDNHNQAIVIVHAKTNWWIDPFNIPPDNFTYDDLTLEDTYLHDWSRFNDKKKVYVGETSEVEVTDDFEVCGDLGKERKAKHVLEYKLCCDREGYLHTSEWYDVGSPLLYTNDDVKYVAGLYTGDNEGEEMAGHFVWSILPDRHWIREQVDKYSRGRG